MTAVRGESGRVLTAALGLCGGHRLRQGTRAQGTSPPAVGEAAGPAAHLRAGQLAPTPSFGPVAPPSPRAAHDPAAQASTADDLGLGAQETLRRHGRAPRRRRHPARALRPHLRPAPGHRRRPRRADAPPGERAARRSTRAPTAPGRRARPPVAAVPAQDRPAEGRPRPPGSARPRAPVKVVYAAAARAGPGLGDHGHRASRTTARRSDDLVYTDAPHRQAARRASRRCMRRHRHRPVALQRHGPAARRTRAARRTSCTDATRGGHKTYDKSSDSTSGTARHAVHRRRQHLGQRHHLEPAERRGRRARTAPPSTWDFYKTRFGRNGIGGQRRGGLLPRALRPQLRERLLERRLLLHDLRRRRQRRSSRSSRSTSPATR